METHVMETQDTPLPPVQADTPLDEGTADSKWFSRNWFNQNQDLLLMIASGLAIGGLGMWLSFLGNPRNAGICISCFMENLAGALSLRQSSKKAVLFVSADRQLLRAAKAEGLRVLDPETAP